MPTDRELMQQALDALEHLQTDIEWQYKSPTRAMLRKVEKSLRARLAQPEPEPVAWTTDLEFDSDSEVIPANEKGKLGTDMMDIPLYTAPPQREWQGLTENDFGIWREPAIGILRWAEAVLRERNK